MPLTVNAVLFRLLLAVVLLAPLPFGAYRPWAWTLLAVLTGGLLAAWGGLVLAGRARAPIGVHRLWPVAVPFALALAWAVIQTLPIAPVGWHHPLWAEGARALPGRTIAGLVSVDPAMTWTAILRLTTYGGVFWLAVQLCNERTRARQGLVWLTGAGMLYAAYGLAAHLSGTESILWFAKWAYIGDLTSTFVNRNAYGAYAGIGLIGCVALFAHALRAGRPVGARDATRAALVKGGPYLIGASLLATALLLTHSRGAFLSTGVALLTLMAALTVGRVMRPRLTVVLTLAGLAAGGLVTAVSGGVTLERLITSTEIEGDRGNLYRLTADAIADAPWSGFGFGAFTPAFRIYRDTSLPRPVLYDFAHNIPMEMVMDLGLPAAGLLYASFGAAVALCVKGLLRRRRDQVYLAVALSATVLAFAHGLVDFSAQMPAIGVTLAFLLGIGVAQSWNSAHHGGDSRRS